MTRPMSLREQDRKALDNRRLGAFLVDLLICAPISVPAYFYERGVWLTGIALCCAYYFLCEATTGQTVGKALFNLRVVDYDGQIARPRSVATRTVTRNFEGMFGLIVFLCSGGKRQRIGDFFARTIVVDAREHPVTRELTMDQLRYPAVWILPAAAILVMNVQGRGPGSYQAEVNRICVEADELIRQDPLAFADILPQEATFLREVDAPLNWEDRHDVLVAEYSTLAATGTALAARVARSKRPRTAFRRGMVRFSAQNQALNAKLASLGYTGCAGTEA